MQLFQTKSHPGSSLSTEFKILDQIDATQIDQTCSIISDQNLYLEIFTLYRA